LAVDLVNTVSTVYCALGLLTQFSAVSKVQTKRYRFRK
jgi:hypothetical protein